MTLRTPEEIASDVVDALHLSPADGYDAIVAAALRFAVEAEREACAKVGDDLWTEAAADLKECSTAECMLMTRTAANSGKRVAEAIRARGKA